MNYVRKSSGINIPAFFGYADSLACSFELQIYFPMVVIRKIGQIALRYCNSPKIFCCQINIKDLGNTPLLSQIHSSNLKHSKPKACQE